MERWERGLTVLAAIVRLVMLVGAVVFVTR
jgi:hypothetical protein